MKLAKLKIDFTKMAQDEVCSGPSHDYLLTAEDRMYDYDNLSAEDRLKFQTFCNGRFHIKNIAPVN